LKTCWKQKQGKITHYVQITNNKVVVGVHAGSGHSDNAAACSHYQFLKGYFHSHVLNHFNQIILDSVIKTVQKSLGYPPYIAKRNAIELAHSLNKSIPLNPAKFAIIYSTFTLEHF